jgi:hypothetical protein
MAVQSLDTRMKTLNAVLSNKTHQKAVKTAVEATNGDMTAAEKHITTGSSGKSGAGTIVRRVVG